ncbi:hypothetical protein B0H17DRAFT_1128627 [Mycena rosella]|uniref:Cytochrome P450 n=1 Tax=Mycena rosella TaxID=1033263 RepID=A0AAD7DWL3_MYCRO|nr:hypothetical protein B0H17DRAFT_1128627 [Mycena rosella]
MPDTLEFYGICLCTAILTIIFISTHCRVRPLRRTIHHTTPEGIRRLLDPPPRLMGRLLRSRALPNARLVAAFKLTNTFVSADPTIHIDFVAKCIELFHIAEKDWPHFNCVAEQAVKLAIPDETIDFRTFVQSVTLSTVVVGLLDTTADITALASDVEAVGDLITQVWILSKKPEEIPPDLLAKLNDHLRRLMPDEVAYPNPLDFVVPVWETLWRVVGVTLAHVHTDIVARAEFQMLNDNPDLLNSREPKPDVTAPSAVDYINEALRLYPPVRHITRHTFKPSRLTAFLPRFLAARLPPRTTPEIADIESTQRSASWGPNPDAYDAGRFLHHPTLARDLLAFGCGPLKCPASGWARGAAAVIVGAILNRVDGGAYEIVRGGGIGGREGWDGWLVQKVNTGT